MPAFRLSGSIKKRGTKLQEYGLRAKLKYLITIPILCVMFMIFDHVQDPKKKPVNGHSVTESLLFRIFRDKKQQQLV